VKRVSLAGHFSFAAFGCARHTPKPLDERRAQARRDVDHIKAAWHSLN
jgi:hypothetical protein